MASHGAHKKVVRLCVHYFPSLDLKPLLHSTLKGPNRVFLKHIKCGEGSWGSQGERFSSHFPHSLPLLPEQFNFRYLYIDPLNEIFFLNGTTAWKKKDGRRGERKQQRRKEEGIKEIENYRVTFLISSLRIFRAWAVKVANLEEISHLKTIL